ncbi:amino acid permease [Francisella halioticida]|nr:amino acid permease [Francisella halioticida]
MIGAFIVLVLGLCFSEIASIYPLRGLSAIITTISHNRFFGFPFAIANWLGIVAVIALEADAAVQYLINIFPQFTNLLFLNNHLTIYGNILSAILVLFFSAINFLGVSLLAKTNNIITVIKLFIPIMVIVILGYTVFHKDNFTAVNNTIMPYGFSSVIKTILIAGIIVSFNGFQSIISFSSEIKNPSKTIPISISISIVVCLIIYLLIQTVFIGALPTNMIHNGWHSLSMAAPMIDLLSMIGLGFLSIIIYVGSTATPVGTAINFTGASSRMFTAMSREGQVPRYFDDVHPKYKVSRKSLIFNTIIAMSFIFLFKSWKNLAEVLSIFHILSYLTVPLAMIVFRREKSKSEYGFYMPFGIFICYALFAVFNYLIGFSSVYIVFYSSIVVVIFEVIFILLNIKSNLEEIKTHIFSAIILIIYILLLPVISYLNKILPDFQFVIFIVIFSSFFLYIMTKSE